MYLYPQPLKFPNLLFAAIGTFHQHLHLLRSVQHYLKKKLANREKKNVNLDVKQMKCILCSSERIIFQLKNSDTCCLICLDTYMKQNPYKSFGYFHRDDHGSSWKERISHAFECSSVYPFSNRFSSFHLGQFTLRQTRCRKDRDIVQMFRNQTIAYDFFSELQNDVYYIFELKRNTNIPLYEYADMPQYEYADMYPSNQRSLLFGIFYVRCKTLFIYEKEKFAPISTNNYKLKNIYRGFSNDTNISIPSIESNQNTNLCTLLNPQIPLYSLYPRINPIFILSRFHHFRSIHFTDIDLYKEYFEERETLMLILYLLYKGILYTINIHGIREYIISYLFPKLFN